MTREAGRTSAKRAVCGLISPAEAPEARVAVIAAIGPNERDAEPDSLDETFSRGSSHRSAFADWALADSFGKGEMHGINTLRSLIMRSVIDSAMGGARPLCAADILT